MKIPSSTQGVASNTATAAGDAARTKGASGKPAAASLGSADVKLSPLSARLKELAASLSGPEFDRAKVDEIKQAIRDGKLAVRTDVIADRMIEDVQDRIGKGSSR